uniref:Uncharacterized protein n=1 Tax=Tetranychus urticae TaxID=32264 RepID=T1KVG6_TETUR
MKEMIETGISKQGCDELYCVLHAGVATQPANIDRDQLGSPPYSNEDPTNSEKKSDMLVLKHVHQDILNEAFLRNRYPGNDKKLRMVDKCNAALENYKNRPLKESEKRKIVNINHWLNNRRKIKKDPSIAKTRAQEVKEKKYH